MRVSLLLVVAAAGAVLLPGAARATELGPTPTPTVLIGDANGDGIINSVDALWVLWFDASHLAVLPPHPFSVAADVNEDGTINSTDAALILQYDAGLIDSLPPRAQLQQSESVVQPEVLEALQGDSDVAVIVSLVPPAAPLAEISLSELQQNTAARQASVLSDLAPSDFTVIYQYESIPALAGRITAVGVDKLAQHPDVMSVAVEFKFGDANCDLSVSSVDALLVLQLDAALIPSVPCGDRADVNQDDRVDSLDAAAILQIDGGILCQPDPLGMPVVC